MQMEMLIHCFMFSRVSFLSKMRFTFNSIIIIHLAMIECLDCTSSDVDSCDEELKDFELEILGESAVFIIPAQLDFN